MESRAKRVRTQVLVMFAGSRQRQIQGLWQIDLGERKRSKNQVAEAGRRHDQWLKKRRVETGCSGTGKSAGGP